MKIGLRNFRKYGADLARQFACAKEVGADCLQLDGIPDDCLKQAEELMQKSGIGICSITALSTAMLGPDMEKSRAESKSIVRAIQKASRLGASCVTVFAGHDPARSLPENLHVFKEVFSPLADEAEREGVSLVFENCPMGDGMRGIRNMAYCPEHWDMMFSAVPSPALGLELDYGHLPGLGIDPIVATNLAARHIKHVGIKDARLRPSIIERKGWIGDIAEFCAVGEGQIPFEEIIPLLAEIGYRGALTLDHYRGMEDDVDTFKPAAEKVRKILETLHQE